ncbi:MAG: hypothetical protein ABL986_00195 [Vicinamibacterales bacterium]
MLSPDGTTDDLLPACAAVLYARRMGDRVAWRAWLSAHLLLLWHFDRSPRRCLYADVLDGDMWLRKARAMR